MMELKKVSYFLLWIIFYNSKHIQKSLLRDNPYISDVQIRSPYCITVYAAQ